MPLVLANIDWDQIGETIKQQQRNRELYAPVVSVYRWWARRPHALIGAILGAFINIKGRKNLKVSDPFSGGGTVAFEAVRRGLPVYAQDLYPWPMIGLGAALSMVSIEEFSLSVSDLLTHLDTLRSAYRRLDGKELSHILRVRIGSCPRCNSLVYLFRDSFISLASRHRSETHALFGCRICGKVNIDLRSRAIYKCKTCGQREKRSKETKGFFSCPHCDFSARIREFMGEKPIWQPIAVQELVVMSDCNRAVLRLVDPDDPVNSTPASKRIPEMRKQIPDGVETHRILESGFKTWGDLYTVRQAKILRSALHRIDNLKVSEACKDRLAIAVIGAAEMPAFLSRWDRYHLKNFEGLANHRYADTTVVVETNPLSPVGRGTLPHRFNLAEKALKWVLGEVGVGLKIKQLPRIRKRIEPKNGIIIATGSSARQGLKDGTIDLVLTDPPYYSDVQYGELARLFHFWLSLYRRLPTFDEDDEAVPNRFRGNGFDFYVRSIAASLEESKRTLAQDGRMILTFHNKKMLAWQALCAAFVQAGFAVKAVAITYAENDADHGKRDGKGMLHDLVLECIHREKWKGNRAIVFAGNCVHKGLLAMGIALTKAVYLKDPDVLPKLYRVELERYGTKEGWIH